MLDVLLLCNKFFHMLGYLGLMNLRLVPKSWMMPLVLLPVVQPDVGQMLDLRNWLLHDSSQSFLKVSPQFMPYQLLMSYLWWSWFLQCTNPRASVCPQSLGKRVQPHLFLFHCLQWLVLSYHWIFSKLLPFRGWNSDLTSFVSLCGVQVISWGMSLYFPALPSLLGGSNPTSSTREYF